MAKKILKVNVWRTEAFHFSKNIFVYLSRVVLFLCFIYCLSRKIHFSTSNIQHFKRLKGSTDTSFVITKISMANALQTFFSWLWNIFHTKEILEVVEVDVWSDRNGFFYFSDDRNFNIFLTQVHGPFLKEFDFGK